MKQRQKKKKTMQMKEKVFFILKELEQQDYSTNSLLTSCRVRNVLHTEKELHLILKEMEANAYIEQTGSLWKAKIEANQLQKLTASQFAQTFMNGGSSGKMIYNPPATQITFR